MLLETKFTISATKSTATSCRIQVVADLLPKPATKSTVSQQSRPYWQQSWLYRNSQLCCRFVAGFGNSRLSTKSTMLKSALSPVCTALYTVSINKFCYCIASYCYVVLNNIVCFQFKRSQLRKGMVMVHPSVEPKACWEFEGDILILHHPTTISVKYQAMGNFTFCPQQIDS